MAFLFKSKNKSNAAGAKAEASSAPPPSSFQNPQARVRDPSAGGSAMTPPGGSVNNSLNSLSGGNNGMVTPSPDQMTANPRRKPSSDASDLPFRNGPPQGGHSGSAQGGNQSLSKENPYPWSVRRLTYTSSHPSPFPRYGAAVNANTSKDGDIYLMGGLVNSSTVKGDLWMVEAGGNMSCYPVLSTAEGPGPRVGHASLLVGNAFIVYGGDTKLDDGDILDETLYLLNTTTRQWSRALPAGPRPAGRYGHSLNILGSKIYVFGGQVEGFFMNDLVAFDLNQLQAPSNRWETLIRNSDDGGPPQGQIPPARTNHSVVTYNEKLYLFGGTNGFQWFNDVWVYSPLENTWTQQDCIGYIPAPREGHAAAIVDETMYVFGGRTEEGADLGDLAAFRIPSRRWYTFQNMGPSPSPRSGHSMTACNKTIVVLGGEPSSATREVQDLAVAYMLDTSKIRYPNDQQIQQTPAGERVPGARRPSAAAERPVLTGSRGLNSREGTPTIQEGKKVNGVTRESVMGPPVSFQPRNLPPGSVTDMSGGVQPGMQPNQGAGTKLPRASLAQSPSPGPPPQQAAPSPGMNGMGMRLPGSGPMAKPGPGQMQERSQGAPGNTAMTKGPVAAITASEGSTRTTSPAPSNGRRTPTQQGKPLTRVDSNTSLTNGDTRSSSRQRQARGQPSLGSIDETNLRNITNRPASPPPPTWQTSSALGRKGSNRNSQTVTLLKELDMARNRNAWYASELELARKQGYTPNPSHLPGLDQRSAESFDDEDRPLIEGLLAMKQEVTDLQNSMDRQAVTAARKIAEVEKQRDAAINEALYAKAKFAAHGGSQNGTPQPNDEARDLGQMDASRSAEISKKLAAALTEAKALQHALDTHKADLEAERRGRQLAEDTTNIAQRRIVELESYKQQNSSEVEKLKRELHELERTARADAIVASEAVAAAKLLQVAKDEYEAKYNEAMATSKDHSETFESLREAISASAGMKNMLERKLDEERAQREITEEKLRKLKAEHEDRTAELEAATRKLRDAEELVEHHANEARTHREAVLAGLDRNVVRDASASSNANAQRIAVLEAQVESANALVKKYQAAADTASEKLRMAEERVAGLEAYQEQVSREDVAIRKQLQVALRDTQSLQAFNSDLKQQLAKSQLETNAVEVQHNTLKGLLGERGISPINAARARTMSSPRSGAGTPESRVKDLEQQLAVSLSEQQNMKSAHEEQMQAAEKAYVEKITVLESDYQSAVHYVKGTEKMLKRMKDELSKYKTDNTRMKTELAEAEEKLQATKGAPAPGDWEAERMALFAKIQSLEEDVQSAGAKLEAKLQQVRAELEAAELDRDRFKRETEEAQRELSRAAQESKANLDQLQQENTRLERRALDAEQKVSLLLDQVESSVDNYRRQSRLMPDAALGHKRLSEDHSAASSIYEGDDNSGHKSLNNRNSVALDSLASELETLRTHWQTTNKNYRLSNTFDFENDGRQGKESMELTGKESMELSGNLADWRRRLEEDESRK